MISSRKPKKGQKEIPQTLPLTLRKYIHTTVMNRGSSLSSKESGNKKQASDSAALGSLPRSANRLKCINIFSTSGAVIFAFYLWSCYLNRVGVTILAAISVVSEINKSPSPQSITAQHLQAAQCLDDGMLVLHVGPSKTGTSSVQCTLQSTPFLQNSSYTYIGRYESICSPGKYPVQDPNLQHSRFFPQAIVFGGPRLRKKAGNKIKMRLLELKASKNTTHNIPSLHPRNAILSAEEFDQMPHQDEETWNLLKDTLSPYEGSTQVIVTHRNLFETIVSGYYEEVVGRNTPHSWNASSIPSFPSYWSSGEGDKKNGHHLVIMQNKLVAAFEEHSFNVSIFDYHGGESDTDDLITRFLCKLPCADATCNAYKNDLATSGRDPSSKSRTSLKSYSQFDRIAKAAYEKGLLGKYDLQRKVTRLKAVRAIEDRINRMGIKYTDLPFVCPSVEELDEILKLSIENGKGLLKDNFDELKLVKSFELFKQKKGFCAVDTDAVIKDDVWAIFLQNDLV